MPAEDRPVILVRLLRGEIGETKRVVHVVRVPEPGIVPDELTAYCGARFKPGTLEFLPEPTGMPCVACLAIAPLPSTPVLPLKPDQDE